MDILFCCFLHVFDLGVAWYASSQLDWALEIPVLQQGLASRLGGHLGVVRLENNNPFGPGPARLGCESGFCTWERCSGLFQDCDLIGTSLSSLRPLVNEEDKASQVSCLWLPSLRPLESQVPSLDGGVRSKKES